MPTMHVPHGRCQKLSSKFGPSCLQAISLPSAWRAGCVRGGRWWVFELCKQLRLFQIKARSYSQDWGICNAKCHFRRSSLEEPSRQSVSYDFRVAGPWRRADSRRMAAADPSRLRSSPERLAHPTARLACGGAGGLRRMSAAFAWRVLVAATTSPAAKASYRNAAFKKCRGRCLRRILLASTAVASSQREVSRSM